MISPRRPDNENERQKAVNKYNLLDTLPEERYDTITDLVAFICDTPIALITLLDDDRNFLKSHKGIPFNESPRSLSFCGHTILEESLIMQVPDAREDERFKDNPLVLDHKIVFYAGVSLVNSKGYKLGTLCTYDKKRRELSEDQEKALKDLAKHVVLLFEQEVLNQELREYQDNLIERNENLQKFAGVVSHDLKSPIANIIGLSDLLIDEAGDQLSLDAQNYVEYLKKSAFALRDYIDGMLSYYRSDTILQTGKQHIAFTALKDVVEGVAAMRKGVQLIFTTTVNYLVINKIALTQVLINLVSNAVKYNTNEVVHIAVDCSENDTHYIFKVTDNGMGITASQHDEIFKLFSKTAVRDRDGDLGSGIGLATVKNIVTQAGGTINLNSTLGKGSTFTFTLLK